MHGPYSEPVGRCARSGDRRGIPGGGHRLARRGRRPDACRTLPARNRRTNCGRTAVCRAAASQVVRFIVPSYVQEDPLLARVLAESVADRAVDALGGKTIRELLPQQRRRLPIANADDTILEVATIMGMMRSPLIAVMKQGKLHGVITASRLSAMALKCALAGVARKT